MELTKMHGLGNDYLYVFLEEEDEVLPNVESLSIRLSDRHKGIGSDGIITISPSKGADFRMHIYNADGSEAMMCGNGIRCVGKYVYDNGYTDKQQLSVNTNSGTKLLDLKLGDDGKVASVVVDMGKALVSKEAKLHVLGEEVSLVPVNVGNPHAVIFTDDAEHAPLSTLGAAIEKNEAFPGGVNVEFVTKLGENHFRMRVWERGSGITQACGTGTCATVAAAISKGYCEKDKDIAVDLDGGTLYIRIDQSGEVWMNGPAETVCVCQVS